MLADRIANDKIEKTSGKLTIDYVPVKDIYPNEYNPNQHTADSFDLLIKSIVYFGFTQPIVVHRATMKIVDGENRFRAACILEMEEVPVCFVDFDPIKLRFATIMHNRARGRENQELITRLYDELDKADTDYKKLLLLDRNE